MYSLTPCHQRENEAKLGHQHPAAMDASMAESPSIAKRDDYCCVPHCNGNARIHRELSFHRFPSTKKKDLRKRWIVVIRRDEGPCFKIGSNTVVCSRHFKQEDFRWTLVRKCLKSDVVPSIFPWTTTSTTRKPPTHRHNVLTELPQTSNANDHTDPQTENQASESIAPTGNNDIHGDCNRRISEHEKTIEELELGLKAKNEEIENLKKKLSLELQDKNEEIENLNKKLSIECFGISRFSSDDNMIEFYTGLPTYTLFLAFYNAVKPTRMRSIYYTPAEEMSARGRPKAMDPIDELFMFLCRLKSGFLSEDLAVRFHIHKSSVSRKIITWANYLYFMLGGINIWPSKETVECHMPQDFKSAYPNTRIIIDCTEIFTERPSSLALASKTFSTYKSHNTWKGLVGIAPHGAVTFISSLYSGCMSDIEITKNSGLIELLEPGDEIMADKGFVLNKILKGTGITIATPHFLSGDGQFSPSQIEDNQKIASLRIHVERHIKRLKEYRLLQSTVPLSIAGSINQFWTVANILTLFRRPLIKQKH
ncbi:uncharacterized protein [Argopecten irradians]|uniref:uncharacterized protein n=1 Tax=Argopecten irradians TaxID=31199 RepID=UPI00371735A8